MYNPCEKKRETLLPTQISQVYPERVCDFIEGWVAFYRRGLPLGDRQSGGCLEIWTSLSQATGKQTQAHTLLLQIGLHVCIMCPKGLLDHSLFSCPLYTTTWRPSPWQTPSSCEARGGQGKCLP